MTIKGLTTLAFFAISSFLIGQDTFNIADGGNFQLNCNDGAFVIDSEAVDGGYDSDELFEITFCLEDGAIGNLEVVLSPSLFDAEWDVDENSFLMVYDGADSGAPLLGSFNSFNDPDGFILTTNGTCITLVFMSGEESSGLGFSAFVRCETTFQPILVDLSATPEFEELPVDTNTISLCFTDSFFVTATTAYPLSDASGDGYEQSDETSYFNWQMGDGTTFQGFGLTEIAYAYEGGSGYQVFLSITDAEGAVKFTSFVVLQSPRPNFSNLAIDDTLCIGGVTELTGGINALAQDTVGVDEGTVGVLGGAAIGGQDNIFDAGTTCDTASISLFITDFEEGQTLNDINDILNICVSVHHTFVGDLEMGLTCPGAADTLILFDMYVEQAQCTGMFPGGFSGGGINLGEPNATPNAIAYDYCWNNEPDFGTFSDEYPAVTETMPEGSYVPEEDFSELLGCPLNGEWQLIFKDNWNADIGVVNGWSIYFNPLINPSTQYFSPTIVEAGWDDNPDLIVNEDSTSVTVTPSVPGNNDFTFFSVDEFGCRHDTTIFVYVRPEVNIDDSEACDLTHLMGADNAPDGGEFLTLEGPTETSELIYTYLAPDAVDILATEYGIYQVEFTDENCAYKDTAEIDFRPYPKIAPFFEIDSVLCGGASIVLNPGGEEIQEENSDNFVINWTRDNNSFNLDDYSVSVNQSGLYVLTMFEPACPDSIVSDTALVTSIEVNFEGDTICDLIPRFTSVDVVPESIGGSWSTSSGDILFSAPDALSTEIIATEFGDYVITYTDVRCPADAVSRNFKWYEQPDLTILPTNPDICYETDTLNLSAVLQGAGSGTYFWELSAINGGGGAPSVDVDLDQNQSFLPRAFDPEVNYMATVESFDEFGRCPQPGRDTLIFKPIACLYDIPNVITPNGDGLNDLFVIRFIEDFPNASLAIFNRWGQEVFSSTSYDQYQAQNGGWDPGDNAGGVYFIELKLPSIDVIESGNLTIITEQGSEQ